LRDGVVQTELKNQTERVIAFAIGVIVVAVALYLLSRLT
jgi:hypothetical protein